MITQFNGADGIIGPHGTNHPELIGSDVRMGCVRMSNADIEKLVTKKLVIMVPVGTPIRIVA